MFHVTRKLLTIAAAVAALGGTGGGAALAATSASASSSASVPRCYSQNISAALHGAESGRGNHVGFILTLTNNGHRSCSLYGYPGLGLQDWNHHILPSHTFWGPTRFDRDPGRRFIVLSPGETASASLAFTTGATRGAVNAAYLVVTPPNDYGHEVVGPFSRSMTAPIYHGNLYVTAMAYHTPHP
ncbi:MAG TPA: DUF4232 domain-containing protein [Streptosporangiaceae bacterium]